MVQAPRPGVGRRIETTDAAKKVMTISIRGDAKTLALGSVPMKEKLVVRKSTGLPLESFVGNENAIGEDSVIVLWWLARRANGEPFLSFDDAVDSWPDDMTADDIVVAVEDPAGDADDPEA